MATSPKGKGGRSSREPVCSPGVGSAADPRSLQDRAFTAPKPPPFPASASTTGAKFISPLNTSGAERGFLKVTEVFQPSSCLGGICSPQITGRASQAPCLHFHTLLEIVAVPSGWKNSTGNGVQRTARDAQGLENTLYFRAGIKYQGFSWKSLSKAGLGCS